MPRTRGGRAVFIAVVIALATAASAIPFVILTDEGETEQTSEEPSAPAVADEPKPRTTTLKAELGEPLTLTAGELSLEVTARKVLDPAPLGEFDAPEPGKRVVAVEYKATNRGREAYDGGFAPVLLTKDGEEAEDAYVSGGGCSGDTDASILPGDSRRTCIAYSVPHDAELGKVQITLEPVGLEEDKAIGIWSLAGAGAESESDDGAYREVPEQPSPEPDRPRDQGGDPAPRLDCPGGQTPTPEGGCEPYDENRGQWEPKIDDPRCYKPNPPDACF